MGREQRSTVRDQRLRGPGLKSRDIFLGSERSPDAGAESVRDRECQARGRSGEQGPGTGGQTTGGNSATRARAIAKAAQGSKVLFPYPHSATTKSSVPGSPHPSWVLRSPLQFRHCLPEG